MTVRLSMFACAALAAASAVAYDIHTKALTPITEKPAPAGASMRFVENGALRFAVVTDDAKRDAQAVALLREVFEKSGKVKASFCGHHHYGDYCVHNGIGYYCQRAMVTGSGPENSSYTEVAIYPSGRFSVTGFRKARTAEWCARTSANVV